MGVKETKLTKRGNEARRGDANYLPNLHEGHGERNLENDRKDYK